VINYPINSFHYWRLNPDQATSDPKKSPDPLAVLMATVEDDSNLANKKRDTEKFINGHIVGDNGGAVGREKDIVEKLRCNDSLA
jgi:hypothetical protein